MTDQQPQDLTPEQEQELKDQGVDLDSWEQAAEEEEEAIANPGSGWGGSGGSGGSTGSSGSSGGGWN